MSAYVCLLFNLVEIGLHIYFYSLFHTIFNNLHVIHKCLLFNNPGNDPFGNYKLKA